MRRKFTAPYGPAAKAVAVAFFICALLAGRRAAGQTPESTDSTAARLLRSSGKRLVLTGNLSVQPNPFRLNAAPLVGYRFGRHTIAGMGPSYVYARNGLAGGTSPQAAPAHLYGGRMFASRRLAGQLFIHAEAEALNHPQQAAADARPRRWTVNPLAGVSWNLNIGQRSLAQLTLLYNFNYHEDSFNRRMYNSPWVFRIGAGVGNSRK